MTVRDFGLALRRRPVVALAVAALTLLLVFRAQTAQPEYEARSVITFLSPKAPFPRNSYASFTPDLVIAVEVSARTLSSEAGRRAVRRAGGTGDFQTLRANRGNQELPIHDQPYLIVTATSPDSGQAQKTLMAVLDVLRTELRDRQLREGAKPGSLISWRVTASTRTPVPMTGQPSRTLLALVLLGGIGMVYLAVLADRHQGRRRGWTTRLKSVRRDSSITSTTNVKLVVK